MRQLDVLLDNAGVVGVPVTRTRGGTAALGRPRVDRPRPPGCRARPSRLVVVAGAVIVVGVLGIGITTVIGGLFPPGAAASGYLAALQCGDTAAAKAVSGTGSVPDLPPSAADRISAVHVGAVTTSGDAASANVAFTVGGKRVERTLELKRDGETAGVFPRWVVAEPIETSVLVESTITDAVRIGGHDVQVLSGGAEIRLLPGVYRAAAKGAAAKYVAFSSSRVVAGPVVSVTLTEKPIAALTDAVAAKVDAKVQQGAASTDPTPSGCPFEVFAFGDVKDLTWSVDTEPTVKVSAYGTSWTATNGAVTAKYRLKDFFSSGYTSQTQHVTMFPLYGQLKVDESGVTIRDD